MTPTTTCNRLTDAPITPIVVPMWLGAERPGPDLGATALHRALRDRWTSDRAGSHHGRLGASVHIPCPVPADINRRIDQRDLAFGEMILEVAQDHALAVRDTIAAGRVPVTIGGDHALAFGSLAGVAWTSERPGVIWFDTHPDLNTPESSISGHIHGRPLGTAVGLEGHVFPELGEMIERMPMIEPADVVMLGIREIDPGEREVILSRNIWARTMEEWHDTGILNGLEQALGHLEKRGVDAVIVSYDVDVLDPSIMPGTGTRGLGGLTYRESSQVLRRLGAWEGPIHAFDMVELNPLLDPSGSSTAIAASLLMTALGARMLPPRD
jgi:arginase